MKRHSTPPPKGGMPTRHQSIVGELTRGLKPVRPVWPAWVQWLVWLAQAVGVTVLALTFLRPQDGLRAVLAETSHSAFLCMTFLASALAAWGAIAVSLPGRSLSPWTKVGVGSLLAGLLAIPLIFFPMAQGTGSFWSELGGCCGCIYIGTAVGLVPWIGMGFLLSRNASFHPAWTGAWAGSSSFLLGTAVIQLHCPSWEMHHVMVGHLMPVALMTLLATWAGTKWFARWRR